MGGVREGSNYPRARLEKEKYWSSPSTLETQMPTLESHSGTEQESSPTYPGFGLEYPRPPLEIFFLSHQ